MTLSILVAMSKERVIGREGQLPWRLSADLQRFKRLTMGHPIIMGRKTFESIGRPLPGRQSIVITRQPEFQAEGIQIANDLQGALQIAGNASNEVFVVGGAQIYALALPLADRLYITLVEADIAGDTFFPEWDSEQWELVEESCHPADAKNAFPTRFQIFDRRQGSSPAHATPKA